MNVLVVYFSKFGNTAEIAETIADALQLVGSVNCLRLDELEPAALSGSDLVIVGVPTHRMNLPESVKAKFQTLPVRILKGTSVAAFDTSYKMSWFLSQFTASKPLIRKLRKLGGMRIIRPETFHVRGKEGPLYEGEIERARQWAVSILAKMGVKQNEPELLRSI